MRPGDWKLPEGDKLCLLSLKMAMQKHRPGMTVLNERVVSRLDS